MWLQRQDVEKSAFTRLAGKEGHSGGGKGEGKIGGRFWLMPLPLTST